MKGVNRKQYVQKPTSAKKRFLNILLSFIIVSSMVVAPEMGHAYTTGDSNLWELSLGLTTEEVWINGYITSPNYSATGIPTVISQRKST